MTLVGRPNVGKSTLLNQLVGSKVAIVSDRPQTTRAAIRGVCTTPDDQIVFVDTPGIHKPRTPLGERTNQRAVATLGEVDVVCLLVEADSPIGAGDRFVAGLVQQVATPKLLIVNKIDRAGKPAIAEHLAAAGRDLGDFDAYLPLSARTGDGIAPLLREIESRLPEGPRYYPEGVVTDQPETFVAAELVREKLLAVARDELEGLTREECAARVEPEQLNSAQIVVVGRCRGDDIFFLSRHFLQDGLGPVELACLDQFVGLLGSLAVISAFCQSKL